MVTPLPPVVRESWGEDVVAAFIPWLEEWGDRLLREKTVPRDEYRQVLSRLDMVERELTRLREEIVALRAEFRETQNAMRAEFREAQNAMRAEFKQDLAEVHTRLDRIYYQMVVQTRWLIAAILGVGTLITLLLAVAQFTP